MSLEELVEHRLIRKIEFEYNLLDRSPRMLQKVLRLEDHVGINPLGRRSSGRRLYDFRQVLRSQTELFSIKSDIPILGMVIHDQSHEAVENNLASIRKTRRRTFGLLRGPGSKQNIEQ